MNTLGKTTIRSLISYYVLFPARLLETNKFTYREVVKHASYSLVVKELYLKKIKAYGQLVLLGFDVTTLTPVAYQRRSLRRPLKVNSSQGKFHA